MVARAENARISSPAANVDERLAALAGEEAACERCPLYRNATRAVPGEGPGSARILLVGEQPGDVEDRTGRPFVGPAGGVLDRALAEAGAPRESCFVTNAVKHFKFEPRGKRRLHKKPDAGEIDACRFWLDRERALLQPGLIVAMGATALRGVLKRPAAVAPLRGRLLQLDARTKLLATVHPSYLLRLPEDAGRRDAWARFISDMKLAADWLREEGGRGLHEPGPDMRVGFDRVERSRAGRGR